MARGSILVSPLEDLGAWTVPRQMAAQPAAGTFLALGRPSPKSPSHLPTPAVLSLRQRWSDLRTGLGSEGRALMQTEASPVLLAAPGAWCEFEAAPAALARSARGLEAKSTEPVCRTRARPRSDRGGPPH